MKVFGFAGKKQSGKGTCANVIHGMVLKKIGAIKDWTISDKGQLLIQNKGQMDDSWPVFDITRRDPEFSEYAETTIWPYVKLYSFADTLKDICIHMFGVPAECVFGTDEQKNTKIEHLLWENMPGVVTEVPPEVGNRGRSVSGRLGEYYKRTTEGLVFHPAGAMTAREFMQFFGTDVMRKIWEPVWIADTMRRIVNDGSEIAIIADVRFPNEAEAIRNLPGNVLRLPRDIFTDGHASETSVDDIDESIFTRILKDGSLLELKKELELLFTPIVDELPIVEQ